MSKDFNSSKDPLAYILPHQFKQWHTIQPILTWMKMDPCTSNQDLFERMHSVNPNISISNLIHVNKTADKLDLWKDKLLSDLIPYIAGLALEIESLFEGQTIRILRRGIAEENNLTRRQISSILANMFFCTLQRQGDEDEAVFLPHTYNFDQIITQIPEKILNDLNIQKLRCWLNYFWIIRGYEYQREEIKDRQLIENGQSNKPSSSNDENQQNEEQKNNEQKDIPQTNQPSSSQSSEEPPLKQTKLYSFWEQVVIFERLVLSTNEEISAMFLSCEKNLSEVTIDNTKGIEEFSEFECVHVDFADKFLGGGVLRKGCVQEEIMFAVSPELMVGIIFTQRIYEHEAILISGTHRFCQFKGYAETFCYNGQNTLKEKYPSQNSQQRTHTLAIDALPFKDQPQVQYSEENLIREITKAYVGFRLSDRITSEIPIITGNWGCGIFKGDPQLKFIIQLIAASFLSRKLYYVPFSNPALKDANKVLLKLKKIPINVLYYQMNQFSYQALKTHKKLSLFEFILDNKNKIGF